MNNIIAYASDQDERSRLALDLDGNVLTTVAFNGRPSALHALPGLAKTAVIEKARASVLDDDMRKKVDDYYEAKAARGIPVKVHLAAPKKKVEVDQQVAHDIAVYMKLRRQGRKQPDTEDVGDVNQDGHEPDPNVKQVQSKKPVEVVRLAGKSSASDDSPSLHADIASYLNSYRT